MGYRAVLRRLLERIYDRRELIILEKALEPAAAGRGQADGGELVEAREGSAAEVLALSDILNGGPGAEKRDAEFLSQGYRCAICFVDGDAVGSCWWTDARLLGSGTESRDPQISLFDITLEEGDAWGFRYRFPIAHRGGGNSTRGLRAIEDLLSREGYTRLVGCVAPENTAARWLYQIRGFEPVRTVVMRLFLSFVAISGGRVFVKNWERRRLTTYPYRRLFVVPAGRRAPAVPGRDLPRPS
jgi:RimJ/RimL family protein N-acetyltransferase